MTQKQLEAIMQAIIARNPLSEKEFFNFARNEAGKFKLPSPEKSKLLSAYHKLVKNKKIKSNSKIENYSKKEPYAPCPG